MFGLADPWLTSENDTKISATSNQKQGHFYCDRRKMASWNIAFAYLVIIINNVEFKILKSPHVWCVQYVVREFLKNLMYLTFQFPFG